MPGWKMQNRSRAATRSGLLTFIPARTALRSGCVMIMSALPCVVLTSILGCGGSNQLARAPVTGQVTLDGEPVSEATILFRPEVGRAGTGRVENGVIVEASTYGINDGIVLGTHKVAIQPIPDDPPPAPSRIEEENNIATPSPVQNPRPARAKSQIPAKYQDVDRSGLTVEIEEDDNELTLELTKE
jgi:hypothetical protein